MIALSPAPATAPRLCARCHERPAIARRPARCTECVGLPRLQRRRYRRSAPRATTIPRKDLTREVMAREALTDSDREALTDRPQTWGECAGNTGPCPWASCEAHMYLDVNPETGSIKINFPNLDGPLDVKEPCVLRVAARGGIILEEVAAIMNLTRERIRQVEVRGLISAGRLLRHRGVEP